MADAASERLKGQCLCGAVTFSAIPQGGMHACHCPSCRRQSGGVSLSVHCGDSLEVQGPVSTYDSSDWAVRQFCSACGSNLFWRLKAGGMTTVSVQAFEDPSVFDMADEIYIDCKPGNYELVGDHPRLTGAEVEAMFEAEN